MRDCEYANQMLKRMKNLSNATVSSLEKCLAKVFRLKAATLISDGSELVLFPPKWNDQ